MQNTHKVLLGVGVLALLGVGLYLSQSTDGSMGQGSISGLYGQQNDKQQQAYAAFMKQCTQKAKPEVCQQQYNTWLAQAQAAQARQQAAAQAAAQARQQAAAAQAQAAAQQQAQAQQQAAAAADAARPAAPQAACPLGRVTVSADPTMNLHNDDGGFVMTPGATNAAIAEYAFTSNVGGAKIHRLTFETNSYGNGFFQNIRLFNPDRNVWLDADQAATNHAYVTTFLGTEASDNTILALGAAGSTTRLWVMADVNPNAQPGDHGRVSLMTWQADGVNDIYASTDAGNNCLSYVNEDNGVTVVDNINNTPNLHKIWGTTFQIAQPAPQAAPEPAAQQQNNDALPPQNNAPQALPVPPAAQADVTGPSITSFVFGGTPDNVLGVGDTITITFSEPIAAHSINRSLVPGGAPITWIRDNMYNKTELSLLPQGIFQVRGIASVRVVDPNVASFCLFTHTLALDATSTVLTLTITGTDHGRSGALNANEQLGVVNESAMTSPWDLAGNLPVDLRITASGNI